MHVLDETLFAAMALPDPPSGHLEPEVYEDCAFVDEPPPELRCPLCRLILRDPFQSMCCGNLYCHCCIQELVKRNMPCALCRRKLNLVFRDVRQWTGELGNLG